jgi:hypothetical protein
LFEGDKFGTQTPMDLNVEDALLQLEECGGRHLTSHISRLQAAVCQPRERVEAALDHPIAMDGLITVPGHATTRHFRALRHGCTAEAEQVSAGRVTDQQLERFRGAE